MTPAQIGARFLIFSAVGWALERVWRGRAPHSVVWGDNQVPALLIYGTGGLITLALADVESIKKQPALVRGAAYATALTSFEWLACQAGREFYGDVGWSYDGACIDVPHAFGWGVLGLAVEQVDRVLFER